MTEETFDDRRDGGEWRGPRSADGGERLPAAHSLADFFRMIEEGGFDQEVAAALQDAAAKMEDMAADTGAKVKATLQINVDISRDPDGIYFLLGAYKIKLPETKRPRSIAWLTPENRFTPNKPKQGNLFGAPRPVGDSSTRY